VGLSDSGLFRFFGAVSFSSGRQGILMWAQSSNLGCMQFGAGARVKECSGIPGAKPEAA